MTAVQITSTNVANLGASPRVVAPSYDGGKGTVRGVLDNALTTVFGTTAGDTVLLLPLLTSDTVLSLKLVNDALDTNGTPTLTVKIGIANGPEPLSDATLGNFAANAVISATLFASASTQFRSANTGTDVRFSTLTASGANKRLWELLGMAADPVKVVYLCLTCNATSATVAAGNVAAIASTMR